MKTDILQLQEDRKNKSPKDFVDERFGANEIFLSEDQKEELFQHAFDLNEHSDKEQRVWVKVINPETGRRISALLCFEHCPQEGGGYQLEGIKLCTRRN